MKVRFLELDQTGRFTLHFGERSYLRFDIDRTDIESVAAGFREISGFLDERQRLEDAEDAQPGAGEVDMSHNAEGSRVVRSSLCNITSEERGQLHPASGSCWACGSNCCVHIRD